MNDDDGNVDDLLESKTNSDTPTMDYKGVLGILIILLVVFLFLSYFAWKKYRRQMQMDRRNFGATDKTPLINTQQPRV